MRRIPLLLVFIIAFTACNEDVQTTFDTQHIDPSTDAKISIDYPKAAGTNAVAKNINAVIEHTIATDMNIIDTEEKKVSVSEAVAQFDREFKTFKKDFPDSHQKWEVKVDGEVTYESSEVISILITSYVDTGGAHGNSVVTYLNFKPQTGELLDVNDILKNPAEFKTTAEKAFKKQTKAKNNDETMEDFFFGEDFHLPENIGFSKNGLVLLYNNYEIASYAQGITKIVLSYADIQNQLKIQL